MECTKLDIVIVGGGIIGLACGVELIKKYPIQSIAILDKESFIGEHTSGRNSEVLHAGFYYQENSLKHCCSVEGNFLWREYISEKKLSIKNTGKFVVAKKSEKESFESLFDKARKMSPGIRIAKSFELNNLKNTVDCDFAFFSETTSVINSAELITSLRNEFERIGGIFLLKNKVEEIKYSKDHFEILVNNEVIVCDVLINAAGLGAIELRNKLLNRNDYSNYWVKGRYLLLNNKINSNNLIYPIPPKDLKGLGIHLTIDTSGQCKFGPDTLDVDKIDYSLNEVLIDEMYPQIVKLFYKIKKEDLSLGYSGIRPKIKFQNEVVTDFVLQNGNKYNIKNYYEFLGIESPGLTAALSLAKKLVKEIY